VKKNAHVSTSLGFGLLSTSILNLFVSLNVLYFILIIVFYIVGTLNDWLDFKISIRHERRFLTHSPLSPLLILIAMLMGLIFAIFDTAIGMFVGFMTYLLFLLHVILDSLNPSGVPLFPYTRYRIANIPYDDSLLNSLLTWSGIIISIVSLSWHGASLMMMT